MKIHKNTILKLIYEPKKVLMTRAVFACLVVSLFTCGLVYIKQHGKQSSSSDADMAGYKNSGVSYGNDVVAMQAHIEALNSRIKHLSIDNKRLSSTGQKLSLQLRSTSENIKEQLAHTKEIQLELYTLDQHLISKYDNFVELQKTFVSAKSECDTDKIKSKGKEKIKSKSCINYAQVKQNIEDLVSQIKFLKAKREILMSELDRTTV